MPDTLSSEQIILRFLLWTIPMLLFSACTPTFVLPGEDVGNSKLTPSSFISFDGTELPLRSWLPAQEIKAIFIGLHGFNDYSNFIRDPAQSFVKHGIAIYSYDQRGFGNAPHRGIWASTEALTQDLSTIIPLIKEKHPGIPLYILGESMGGAVAMVAQENAQSSPVNGVILVAPALWSRSSMPFYQRWALWLGVRLFPWKKFTGESLDITASDNSEMLKELGKDPLIIKGTRVDAMYGLTNLMDEAYQVKRLPDAPTLILYGGKDEIIPKEPVFTVITRLHPKEDSLKKFLFYQDGYHMLLRDLKAESTINDIISWLNDHVAVLPSQKNNTAVDVFSDRHATEFVSGR